MTRQHPLSSPGRPLLATASPHRDAQETDFEFSPTLRSLIDGETRLRTSRAFDSQFWTALEERRTYSRTWRGKWQHLCEVEMNGVAVWRVLGSGALGALGPALVLAFCLVSPVKASVPLSIPQELVAFTPFNQRKFWEEAAWKTPFRSTMLALLDPNLKIGGESCAPAFPLTA